MVGGLVMVSYHLVASLAVPDKNYSGCGAEIRACSGAYILNKILYLSITTEQTYKVVMCPLARWQSYVRAGIRHLRAHILNSGM